MSVEEVYFIPRENMTSVYNSEDIMDLSEKAYFHFMNYEEEILYILEEENVKGLLSIGDLERFYNDDVNCFEVNQKYTFLNSVDYDEAVKFFGRVRSVNEIPVISANNRLEGIIRYKKAEELRKLQRRTLQEAKKNKWYRNEIRRFISSTKAKVLLYAHHTPSMRYEEYEIWKKRQRNESDVKWKGMEEDEWKIFWGSEYEDGIADAMEKEVKLSNLVVSNGIAAFSDRNGRCYQFIDGYRVTKNNPVAAERNIFMFGPCIVLGGYCKDEQTIETYLQDLLIRDGYIEWKVLNRGLFGPEYCYHSMFAEKLTENDIVIIWYEEKWLPKKAARQLIFQGDLTDVFDSFPSLADYFVDSTWHCNYLVNQRLAQRMYGDLCATGALDAPKRISIPERIQNYYIGWDIWKYFSQYFEQYKLYKRTGDGKSGAIVMNCNPFTKGHRYLIEQALKTVENLYIFVVEEDKSYFKFQDRLEMVRRGVSDLAGVHVAPSGRYIISQHTFAQYFEKDQIERVDSMDYDVYIFGEVVAAGLGIQYRFVGEEPLDQVTRAYNDTLKRILPDFGVMVIEIPRITVEKCGQEVVSATLVRKALQEKDMYMLEKLCPESTITYLKEQRNL